ncbi:MAG: hypothetical protein ACYC1I_12920 [Acidimicrobiales bacterium]
MNQVRHAVLFCVLLASMASSSGAQQSAMKDPDIARQYSFYLPGGGHFYTGEYVRGGAMLGVGLYAGQQVAKTFSCGSTNKSDYTYSGTCPAGGALLWLGILAVPYVYGIFDARASADRVNAKMRAQSSRLSPFVGSDPRGRPLLGLSVRTH